MPEGHAPIPRPAGDDAGTPAEVARRRFGRYAVLWGILAVSGAFAIFSLHDAGIKWLVAGYAPLQVLFIRSCVILAICAGIGRERLVVQCARSPIRDTLLVRSLGLLGAWLCFYTAAKSLQLAELTTIYFASPLMVAALAVPILGERVSPARWASITVGFVGVLIACRPDVRAPAGAIGLALAAACLWAGSMILIRQVALKESTLVQMMTSSFAFVVLTGPAMFWFWKTPDPMQFVLMASIGTLGAVAQYLLIEGIKRAPASVVSPLEFSALVWSFVLGYAIWGDVPAKNVFAGAGLILVSGALIVLGEWRSVRIAARAEAAE
ncbi:MAG TPA: DMT family transporter [Dongiaceae bacterium]|jgi:drug/metabolite transporter (DMT)-like permease|nr:DMT family transporter [Dongiaceae bacterium]